MKNVYFFLLILFLTKSAYAIEFQGKFIQGHFIIGKTDPKTKVWIDKNKVRTSDDGYFVFGIGRDRKYDVVITLNNNGNKQRIVKKVLKRKYNIQRIDGLPEEKVTPPEEMYERIKKENILIGDAKAIDSNLTYFKNKFIVPIENAIIWLDTHDKTNNFHLVFLMQLTKFLGFYPNTPKPTDSFFNMQEGTFTFHKPIASFISNEKFKLFKSILGTNFEAISKVSISAKSKQEIVAILIEYFSLHLPEFRKPKSLAVLQTVFR